MFTTKRWLAATAAMVGALALMAPAAMGAVPAVSTGGANGVTADAAKLHGSVNPRGRPTAYYFEYGTSRRYGSRTPDTNAGSGSQGGNRTPAGGGPEGQTKQPQPDRPHQPGGGPHGRGPPL